MLTSMTQGDNSNRDDVDRVLEIRRASIGESEVHEEPLAALEDGQIRLRIDRSWMTIDERRGPDGPAAAWASIYAGEVTPDVGVIASFHP